jgi:uncharacterized protein (UPF0276 family)
VVFLAAVANRSDCGILLDVNNIYVSAVNHGFDPMDYLRGVPANRVGQFHLAGHSNAGTHLVDTHDHPVSPQVWDLYREAVHRFGRVSSLIERDDNIPAFEYVVAEADLARAIAAEVLDVPASLREIQQVSGVLSRAVRGTCLRPAFSKQGCPRRTA